jgi:hypothetical protein
MDRVCSRVLFYTASDRIGSRKVGSWGPVSALPFPLVRERSRVQSSLAAPSTCFGEECRRIRGLASGLPNGAPSEVQAAQARALQPQFPRASILENRCPGLTDVAEKPRPNAPQTEPPRANVAPAEQHDRDGESGVCRNTSQRNDVPRHRDIGKDRWTSWGCGDGLGLHQTASARMPDSSIDPHPRPTVDDGERDRQSLFARPMIGSGPAQDPGLLTQDDPDKRLAGSGKALPVPTLRLCGPCPCYRDRQPIQFCTVEHHQSCRFLSSDGNWIVLGSRSPSAGRTDSSRSATEARRASWACIELSYDVRWNPSRTRSPSRRTGARKRIQPERTQCSKPPRAGTVPHGRSPDAAKNAPPCGRDRHRVSQPPPRVRRHTSIHRTRCKLVLEARLLAARNGWRKLRLRQSLTAIRSAR